MFFYKIDDKTKKQMREELALRHAGNAVLSSDGADAAVFGVENPVDAVGIAEAGTEENNG